MTKIEIVTCRCSGKTLLEAQEILDEDLPGYTIVQNGQIYDESNNYVTTILYPRIK